MKNNELTITIAGKAGTGTSTMLLDMAEMFLKSGHKVKFLCNELSSKDMKNGLMKNGKKKLPRSIITLKTEQLPRVTKECK